MRLNKILKTLITEIASIQSIGDAIDRKKVVSIYYDGDEPGGRGLRTIEPVCLFVDKRSQNTNLCAWDREGASHKVAVGDGVLPGWRLFRLDKILSFNPTGENFTQMRPGFNPQGDKRASRIIYIAKF
jgi:predicted DNA-binding transcriptional regulator YafY